MGLKTQAVLTCDDCGEAKRVLVDLGDLRRRDSYGGFWPLIDACTLDEPGALPRFQEFLGTILCPACQQKQGYVLGEESPQPDRYLVVSREYDEDEETTVDFYATENDAAGDFEQAISEAFLFSLAEAQQLVRETRAIAEASPVRARYPGRYFVAKVTSPTTYEEVPE